MSERKLALPFLWAKNEKLILILEFILDQYIQENAHSTISIFPQTPSEKEASWIVYT